MGFISLRPARLVVIAALTVMALAAPRLASAQVSVDVVHTFAGLSPSGTVSALVQGIDGNLYGTTSTGGAANLGMAYRMTLAGSVTVLHEFVGGSADGANPSSDLIQSADGIFYGTTNAGGPADVGTVFRMTPTGTVTILHAFAGGISDGANPSGGLIQALNGNFYGTTSQGGSANLGTVFQMTHSGTVTILHAFVGGAADPATPRARVIQAADGNFYGTTTAGGESIIDPSTKTTGTVFRMTPVGVVTILYRFPYTDTLCHPVSVPFAPLIQATDWDFYGTTSAAGPCASGYVFKLTQGGTFTILADLPVNGALGNSQSLIQGSDGNLYGTAFNGFANSGVAFALTTGGSFKFVHPISPTSGGQMSSLIQASDEHFYGTSNNGVVYRLGAAPAITTQPSARRVRTARSTTFTVAASGTPSPTIQWQVSIAGGLFTNLANNPTYSGVTSTTLAVTGVVPSFNDRQYCAVATNIHGSATSAAATLTVSDTLVVDGDVNGDSKGDLLWRHAQTGDVAVWLMNGATVTQGPVVATGVPLAWQIAGTGDLNGDGNVDLVWRHAQTGDVSVWLMNGTTILQAPVVAAGVPLPWQIAGVGDLDGDGKADLVWRNATTGDVAVWLMNGATVTQGPVVAAGVPLAWQIAGVADLDGDGKADLVWRHTQTGDVSAWLMNGATIQQAPVVAAGVSLAWQIVGVGDLDGDGKTDLVWRQTQSGEVAVWLMNGATVTQNPVIATGPLSWQIATLRDVDGDGKADLVWRSTTSGDLVVWLMNGVTVTQQPAIASGVPLAWQIQP